MLSGEAKDQTDAIVGWHTARLLDETTKNTMSGQSSGADDGIEVVPSPPPGEGTSLLDAAQQQSPSSAGGESSTVGSLPFGGGEESSSTAEASVDDADELDRPWPATFGRTISILAGPHVGDADFVKAATMSPKVTPSLVAYRKDKRRFKSAKGSMTPEMRTKFMASPMFKKGMAKYHSLDWKQSMVDDEDDDAEDKIREQERKDIEAKAYRLKVLSQAGGGHKIERPRRGQERDEEAAHMDSPGFRREQESDKLSKQAKEEEAAKASKESSSSGGRDATFSQCCFNMANILMGVGMLGLPFVFKSAGWLGGFFVTLSFGAVTWRTSVLIGRELNGDYRPCHTFDDNPYKSPTVPGSTPSARMRKPINSFPDIARVAFGENGCICLSSVLYFELFSCLSIFFVTLGDHLHTLFPEVSETKHMIIVAILLTIPTAVLRTPKLLSYLSAVGTFATIAVVLSVVAMAIWAGDITETLAERAGHSGGEGRGGPYHTLWRTSGLPVAFGLIAYTFSGHAIVPSIYSSMARPQDFERMIDATFAVVISCCLLVAVAGYAMFGSFVEDQVTISLMNASIPGADLAMTMLSWLMILTAFSKFTLTMFPLAIGIEEIVAPFVPSERVMETASALIKLILIVMSLAVAIFVPSFSFLCSLVGLICTMIVSAIFPAAAHLKMFGDRLPLWEKVLDWFFVVAGSFMAIVGTAATISM